MAGRPHSNSVGLIAAETKWRVMREALLAQGISAERCDQVHAPAGLDLGAETQGEIALSVLAEIRSSPYAPNRYRLRTIVLTTSMTRTSPRIRIKMVATRG